MNNLSKRIISRLKKEILARNPWYQQRFQDCPKFWNRFPFNLQVVNLGSSTSFYGFDYSGLSVNGANWAIRPQSFPQDFALLKTYESFLGPRAIIIIALCPYSSCLKSYKDTELEKYYTILHPGAFENFSLEKCEEVFREKNNPFSVASKNMLKSEIRIAIHIAKAIIKKVIRPKNADVDFERSAKSFIDGWMKQFKIDDMSAPLPPHIIEGRKKRVDVLSEMVQFCTDRDFTPVIVIPPVTPELSAKFSPVFRENYMKSFLREGAPGVKVLDYLDDTEFANNHSLFQNSLFLNPRGASLFTRRVLTDLGLIE